MNFVEVTWIILWFCVSRFECSFIYFWIYFTLSLQEKQTEKLNFWSSKMFSNFKVQSLSTWVSLESLLNGFSEMWHKRRVYFYRFYDTFVRRQVSITLAQWVDIRRRVRDHPRNKFCHTLLALIAKGKGVSAECH